MSTSSENTANLQLPFIMPSQAQKHVSHNEALRMLDALVQPAVLDRDLASPPPDADEGNRYIVAAGAIGEWAGKDGRIAARADGAWFFLAPREGWLVYVVDEGRLLAFDGTTWHDATTVLASVLQNLSLLGIGTTADATNPLAARLNNALLTARYADNGGTGDLRIKANKESAGNAASILFQTDYAGRAELGLLGNDDFTLKLSGSGSGWTETMRMNKPVGDTRIDGNTTFPAHVGVNRTPPNNYWSPSGKALWMNEAYFGTNGSYGIGLWWNGYRNMAGGWTSFGLNGYSAGGGLEIQNGGIYLRHEDSVAGSSPAIRFQVTSSEASPAADDSISSGSASRRWSQVFAVTGTISTSDAREKDVVGAPIEAERRAGRALLKRIVTFRRRDALAEKGRAARLHVGITAQDVAAAFEAEGLDARSYALFCEDEIVRTSEDAFTSELRDVPTGRKKLGLRYDQLMMFCLAALAD